MTPVADKVSSTQGLRELSRGVLGEADAEARQIISDADTKADSIRQQARSQAETRRDEILRRARREVEPIRGEVVATAQLEAQRVRLESREELLGEVFSAARDALKAAPQWSDYLEILRRLISEAAARLASEEVILHADEQTQQHLCDTSLDHLAVELDVRLQRGRVLDDSVGIVAETHDGHRRYENTLEARLHRLEDSLRAPVYRLLKGGSL